jgi:hypothetical protein
MGQCHRGVELPRIAAAVAAIVIILICASRPIAQGASDYLHFYAGGKLLGTGLYSVANAVAIGEQIVPGRQTVDSPVWWVSRPPFYYTPFAPLSQLSYPTGAAAWMAFNVAALAAFMLLWPMKRIDALVHFAFFPPLLTVLVAAQDSIALLALIAVASAMHIRGRDFAAGLAIGLCVAAKPSTMLFLPLAAVVLRSWRMGVGVASAWTAAYLASAVIMLDPLWPVAYLRYLLAVSPFSRTVPFWCIPIAAAILTFWCKGKSPHVTYAVLLAGGLLLTPRALYYDLTFLLPLLLLLIARTTGAVNALLYLFPYVAAITWAYLYWDGVRVLVAVLLLGATYLMRQTESSPNAMLHVRQVALVR